MIDPLKPGAVRGRRRVNMGDMQMDGLMVEVEAAFARTAAGLERWADPHPPPDRVVADEEYSRLTNPSKWRIIGARADAWIDALVSEGLATVERDADPAVQIVFIPDCGCDACDSGSQDVIDLLDSYVRPVVSGEFHHLWRGRQSITVLEDGRRQSSNIGMSEGSRRPDEIAGGWFRYRPTSRPAGPLTARAPRPRVRSRDRMAEILADPTGWDERSGPSWLTGPHGDLGH